MGKGAQDFKLSKRTWRQAILLGNLQYIWKSVRSWLERETDSVKRVQLQSGALPLVHEREHGGVFQFSLFSLQHYTSKSGFPQPNTKSKQNRDYICSVYMMWSLSFLVILWKTLDYLTAISHSFITPHNNSASTNFIIQSLLSSSSRVVPSAVCHQSELLCTVCAW